MTTSKKASVRFTLDIPSRKIVGSKASFDKAGKGQGPIYDELARLMALHPDFGFEVKVPVKRSAKPKQTYKGMDLPFMMDFASAMNDAAFRSKMELVVKFANNAGKKVYPIANVVGKRLFLEHYAKWNGKPFNYAVACEIVDKFRFNGIITEATNPAASVENTESNETLKKAS